MSPSEPTRRALVMAFDETFAVGAETALYSFLRHNPWFDGRVVVIGDGLGVETAAALARRGSVDLVNVDPALAQLAERLVQTGRIRSEVGPRLYSLALFALSGLERAVFLDADTICLGDVRALFDERTDFAAAPDLVELQRAFLPEPDGGQPYGRALRFSFNSGVMSVAGRWLKPEVYLELLQLPGLSDGARNPELADQLVLNRYFDGKVTALDARYNFLVCAESLLRQRFSLALPDIRILHFAGHPKPWQHSWEETRRRVPPRFLRYYEIWHELRQELEATLGDRQAFDQYRAGLAELSLAARGERAR